MICIFASEAATLLGKNPYEDKERAFRKVLDRHGLDLAASVLRIEGADLNDGAILAVQQLFENGERRLDVILETASSVGMNAESLKAIKKAVEVEVKKEEAVAIVLEHARVQIDEPSSSMTVVHKALTDAAELLGVDASIVETATHKVHRERHIEEQQIVNRITSSPVIIQSIASAQSVEEIAETANVCKRDQAILRAVVHTQRGTRDEQAAIASLKQPVVENNSKFYSTKLITTCGKPYVLGGRIDGKLQNGKLIEVKCRQRRFFPNVPDYERVQCEIYMRLLDLPTCEHVQYFRGENRKQELSRNDSLWTEITSGLGQIVDRCESLLAQC